MLLTQSFAWPLISIRDHVTVQNKGLQHRFTGQFTLRAQGVQSSSNAGLLPPLESSPAFDESPRQPTQNEVAAITAGSLLTPEQRLARELQLPITLPVRSRHPGMPSDRQLMAQIKGATSWQELEAVLNQQCKAFQTAQTATSPSAPRAQQSVQDQQQKLADDSNKKVISRIAGQQPRRRQQPKPLSIQPKPAVDELQAALLSSTAADADAHPRDAQGHPSAAASSIDGSPFNHIHVTEVVRKLIQLLPSRPQQLDPGDRGRAAALVDLVFQLALQLAQQQQLDPRAIAHIASGLAKLGHKDHQLVEELQLCALLQMEQFSPQHVAILSGALVSLTPRPGQQLLHELQQHIIKKAYLFQHQSLANTLWALSKLLPATAGRLPSNRSINSSTTDTGGLSRAAAGPSVAPSPAATARQTKQKLLSAVCEVSQPYLPRYTARHLAQLAWSLAKLGARPSTAWKQALLAASQKQFWQMQAQDLANLMAALPELSVLPEQAWVDGWCGTCLRRMEKVTSVGVYSMLFGLAKLRQLEQRLHSRAIKQEQEREARQQVQSVAQQQEQGHEQTGYQMSQPKGQQQLEQMQPQQKRQGLEQTQQHEEDEEGLPLALNRGIQSEPLVRTDLGSVQTSSTADVHPAVVDQSAAVAACSSQKPVFVSSHTLTPAEVSWLAGCLLWLQCHLESLNYQQVSGVVVALSQLLPDSILQQMQHEQQHQQQQQMQPIQEGLVQHGNEQQQVVLVLHQLLTGWAAEVSQVQKALPKKQMRLFKVAWGRLGRHLSQDMSATQQQGTAA